LPKNAILSNAFAKLITYLRASRGSVICYERVLHERPVGMRARLVFISNR
jgi:hypothetical protein